MYGRMPRMGNSFTVAAMRDAAVVSAIFIPAMHESREVIVAVSRDKWRARGERPLV